MEIFGILWDLDGVLADSTQLHYQAWRETMQKRGLDLTFAMFTHTFGQNNRAALTYMLGRPPAEDELNEIADEKEIYFREHIAGKMELLPGVADWLKRFQGWGYRQAVASSAPPENIEVQIDCLQIRPYFDALVASGALPGKPNPAVFLKAAECIAMPPQRCLVIEDAPAGVAGAKSGGMRCLAVLTTHGRADLQEADLIVNRLTDLDEEQLRRLLGK
jgi:HAD superfamily hydrolase (TIGR01509 family)